ncbi:MAG: hypothetical protein PWQ70_573 [Clostridiales bacterium]|nr:hypothetical protein [Clostridiales bacterium]
MITIKSKRGEGYIDTVVIVIAAMLVIALAVKVFPVFVVKHQLNTFANEICRVAEISGRTGSEMNTAINDLKESTGLDPSISWSAKYISGTNRVQLGNEITVTLTQEVDIGFFTFGSFPITLTSKAIGKSEVYWK